MIKLINGDCLDKMKDIPDGSIDMVLTDPPYGTTACKWDVIIPFDPMWEQLHRITKVNGAIVIFGGEPFSSALRISNIKNYKYDWYWRKEKPVNVFQLKKRAGKTIENICMFYRKQPTYNPIMRVHKGKKVTTNPKGTHSKIYAGNTKKITIYKDTGFRYPDQVLEIRREKNGTAVHPTQKPVALMEYLVKSFSDEGQMVLDFAMGSGSTGVACKNLDRNFIGIELDKKYFDIAKGRI